MTTDSKNLSDIYGEGYFYGKNSGYPKIGYEQAHPSWKNYIDFVKSFKGAHIQWLDVGCAFGYLLKETEEKGISAFGVDISTYALKQLSEPHPKLSQGLAERLPFGNETFDVVTAFDLVEHLYEPKAGLEEMVRVLKDEGILFFSTPDPLLFNREEETHFSENPPSFWMNQMEQLGLRACLRFYGEPFNLEIMAIKGGNDLRNESIFETFNRDYFGKKPDILKVPSGNCQVVLRKGWSELHEKTEAQGVRYLKENASIYIYNGGRKPVEVELEIRLGQDTPLMIHTQLARIGIESVNKEDGTWRLKTDKFLLPPGGHEIDLRYGTKNVVEVQNIVIHFTEKEFSEYTLTLPVDQYQRYQILQQTVNVVREPEKAKRILEVGGVPGQISGFLPEDDVTIADMEYCDIPNLQIADGLELPFSDESFDIAVSIDVLEHISPKNRRAFLSELMRVSKEYVFVGAPFADPALREAEQILFEFIHTKLQHTHRFLDEHLSNPLPDQEETIQFFNDEGLDTVVLPNGYLSHWLLMIMMHFYLDADPQLNQINRKINQYYNKYHYSLDNRSPAYRHLIIGCKHAIPEKKREDLHNLLSPEKAIGSVNFTPTALLIELLNIDLMKKKDITFQQLVAQNHEKDKALQNLITHSKNLAAIVDANNKTAQNFIAYSDNLVKVMDNKEKTIRELITHSENLANALNEKSKIIKQVEEEARDLEARLLSSLEQNSFLAGRVEEIGASLDSYCKHIRNLELIVNHPLVKLMRTCKRILSLRK